MEQRAEKQQRGENNKAALTRGQPTAEKQEENRGTELKEETLKPRDTFLASRIYMRAKPSPGYVRKARQAAPRAARLGRCH